ncbi:TRAP transporter large permease [Ancylobacter moscoviensis]
MNLLFLSFVGLLLLGMEVGFAMIVAAWLGLEFKAGPAVDAIMLPTSMLGGISLYALVQIPLFILAGEVMNRGGITRRLVEVSSAWIGQRRGSLGHVGILSNLMLSGISGSAVADAVATGKALIPEMRAKGYGAGYSGAVIASGALLGPIIPPSIPMVVYAQIANVSVAKMFLAGVLPGLLLAAGFLVICSLIGKRRGLPREPAMNWRAKGKVTVRAVWALLMPIIILVGIRMGLMTDTEIAAIAVIYALLVGFFVYRTMKLRDLPAILMSAGRSSAVILFLLAAAAPFSWLVAESQISEHLVEMIRQITDNPHLILLIINVLLLLVGLVLEPLPAMVIFLPALLPLAAELGIDPIHFGAVVVVNLMIGLLHPPIGLLLFVVCSIDRLPFMAVAREVLPFLAWSIMVLVLIIFFPPLTVWLGQGL